MRKLVFRTCVLAALIFTLLGATAYAENATVTGSDVNLRAGPGINYEVLGCLEKGSVVTVNDTSNADWYSVTYNGTQGFMSSRYLELEKAAEPEPVVDTGSDEGYINAMYVSFRSGPSTDATIRGTFNTGTPVTILGEENGWVHVCLYGYYGYVYGSYITRGSYNPSPQQPEPTPAPTPTPAPEVTPAPTQPPVTNPTEGRLGYINGNSVRFRSGPSTSSQILGTYDRGQVLMILGTSGEWSQVTIEGVTGYVYSQYVLESSSSGGGSGSSEPAPSAPPVETTPPQQGEEGYINGNNVRFRSGPSTSSQILGEYNSGKALSIVGSSGDWTQVVIDGVTGYVYSQYVARGSISVPVTPSGSTGEQIAQFALQYEGYPYVWAGKSPETGFDCSGFVYYVYSQFGYTLPRVANDQANAGSAVSLDNLQPGDVLCFYSGSNYVGHVGIYIGNNRFIHASTYTTGVIISELSGYYSDRGYTARRFV